MPSIYVHLSGRDVDSSVLSIYGIKDTSKAAEPKLKAEPCPRCREANDPAGRFCRRCGLPLGKLNSIEKTRGCLLEFLIAEAFPEVREKFREVVRKKGSGGGVYVRIMGIK